jgi:hypothetical protein
MQVEYLDHCGCFFEHNGDELGERLNGHRCAVGAHSAFYLLSVFIASDRFHLSASIFGAGRWFRTERLNRVNGIRQCRDFWLCVLHGFHLLSVLELGFQLAELFCGA